MRHWPRPSREWWHSGNFEGRPMRDVLGARDITGLFRFLRSRGFSRSALAAATGLSETRVREIVQGRQQVTSYEVLERIADGLGVERGLMGLAYAGAAELPVPGLPVGDPGDYQDFLGAMAAFAVGSVPQDAARLLPAPPSAVGRVPAVVTGRHVAVLREISDRHRRFDADGGGGSCRDSAVAYLRWAHGLLGSRPDSDETARALKVALSDLYQVAGWACHDLGDHGDARRYLAAGLALAREIDDLPIIAGGFYRLGRVSVHQGRAREALRLWQLGQIVAQDSGCLVSVAVLHANEAWAYALLGSDELVCDALARAEGELARVDAESVPPWARFFLSPADINGMAGVVYTCLAAHPQHRTRYAPMAIERSEEAYRLRREGEARSHTFDAISLATACLLDGELREAERHGHTAVDLAERIASMRAVDRLANLARLAAPRAGDSGIEGLRERVALLTRG